MLINIVLWIVIGGLAGWIASIVMGADESMGILANVIVGILGAIIGGFIVGLFGIDVSVFSIVGLLVAILGAIILLYLIRTVRRTT